MITNILVLLANALYGGLIYYFRGAKTIVPKPTFQILFAVPYAAVVCYQANWYMALLCLIVTTFGVWTGHGNFQALNEPNTPRIDDDRERLEFLISWLPLSRNSRTYKVLGLLITGLAITAPAALILLNPFILLTAIFKPIAYIVGALQSEWMPTRYGETMTGALMISTLLVAANVVKL